MLVMAATVALAASVAALASSSSTRSNAAVAAQPATKSLGVLPTGTAKLCGTDPIRIAHVDGFGANSWRKIVRAELASELKPCKNVTISYAQAGGDIQKYNTAINSFVAQGYDAIVTYDDFGPQGLPVIRKAFQAGVPVVPYTARLGGVPGKDYTAFIGYSYADVGKQFGAWLNKTLHGKGNVIFMGGIPGNPSSAGFMRAAVQSSAPGIKWLQDKPVDTNWDPAQYQRVTAGLISKYPKIDAYVSDYGAASVGQLRAYISAGKPHPPMATLAASNELGCMYQQLKKKWPNFQMVWIEGTTRVVRWAGRRALAAVNDIKLNDPTSTFRMFPFVDTTVGKEPKCRKDLPPDADLSSGLTPKELAAVFG
jgi:ribose transport system substrate-binding protein